MDKNQNSKAGFIAQLGLFYAAAIWGATFYVVKDSLRAIDPVLLVGYRFLIAAFVLLLYLLFRKKKLFENFFRGSILGLLLWLLYIFQTIGLKYTSASNSGFITGLFIVFVPFFSFVFFRSKPGFIKLFSVLLALSGLWLLTGGLEGINKGDCLTLVTALVYALHILFADRFVTKENPYVLSFQQFLTVGILSIIFGLIFNLPFTVSSSGVLWVILFLALFPTLSAFVIQLVAQKILKPFKVALIFTLEPVFAAIFAWTLGGEEFITVRALGGFLVVAAMVLTLIAEKIKLAQM